MPKRKILKKHVGRPVDFHGCGAAARAVTNGRVEKVGRGIATVRYWTVRDEQGNLLAHSTEGYLAYLSVSDSRIVAVY